MVDLLELSMIWARNEIHDTILSAWAIWCKTCWYQLSSERIRYAHDSGVSDNYCKSAYKNQYVNNLRMQYIFLGATIFMHNDIQNFKPTNLVRSKDVDPIKRANRVWRWVLNIYLLFVLWALTWSVIASF